MRHQFLLLYCEEITKDMPKPKYNKPYYEVYVWDKKKNVITSMPLAKLKDAEKVIRKLKKLISDPDITYEIIHWDSHEVD